MFKPVTGADALQYDEETRRLYRLRESDPRLTKHFLELQRKSRNHLPVIAKEGNQWVAEKESYIASYPIKLGAGLAFFIWAGLQFQKAYFPYGIILRRSIPQTWAQYASHRAPIGAFVLFAWYMQREYPRTQRIDLRCDSEN